MPYLTTAQQWLTQSALLLQARPSTTRITSKYTIAPLTEASKTKSATESNTPAADAPRATLTLKTYDPVSGATLKYSTNKAAEVSRLIQILGRLARPMAGLPELKEEVPVTAADGIANSGPGAPAVESAPALGAGKGNAGGAGQGQSGKKGKKKGKK